MRRWVAAIVLLLALGGCGRPRQAPNGVQFPPGRPHGTSVNGPAGMSIYEADCASCHGAGGKGGIAVGDAVSADIRWSTLSKLNPPYTDVLLRRAILDGIDQTGKPLNANMPRWRGRLSAGQVSEVIAYLHTLH